MLKRARARPEFEAARLARLAESNAKPETRAKNSRAQKAFYARNPQAKDALREHGKRHYAVSLGSEKCRVNVAKPEVRAAVAASTRERHDRRLAWCPTKYRAEYHALVRARGMNAAKAVMIEERIPPFEMQLWRVQKGAGISTRIDLPSKSYDYTLAGGSPL